jgi:hypothetical protein
MAKSVTASENSDCSPASEKVMIWHEAIYEPTVRILPKCSLKGLDMSSCVVRRAPLSYYGQPDRLSAEPRATNKKVDAL